LRYYLLGLFYFLVPLNPFQQVFLKLPPTKWEGGSPDSIGESQDDTGGGSPDSPESNHPLEPTHESNSFKVLELINQLTGVKYTLKAHGRNINARLKDGYSLQDLLSVVTHKTQKWLHEPEMSQYLRPSTLFSTGKFPGYLIAAKNAGTQINYRGNFQDRDYGETGKIS